MNLGVAHRNVSVLVIMDNGDEIADEAVQGFAQPVSVLVIMDNGDESVL